MTQLELHKKIQDFFQVDVESANIKFNNDLFINEDAKRFFFNQANETWLALLWNNGFLDEIKRKAEDSDGYTYRLPELEYLARMAEKDPVKIAEIINAVKISENNFNPEVIVRFLWIIGTLPAEQIKTLTAKIRDERWVYLMRDLNKSGYDYKDIVEKLTEKKEVDGLLELAQGILTVKSKEEFTRTDSEYRNEDPFYIKDVHESGIFEALAKIEDSRMEDTLRMTTDIMNTIVKLADIDESKAFDYKDIFALYDVDFFELDFENRDYASYRADEKNFAATLKELIKRTIGNPANNAEEARRMFGYIDRLPSSRLIWRLRLFTLAQRPDVFKNELKNAFFRLFDAVNDYDIEGGTEYKKTLKIGFSSLSDVDQRDYISKIFDYYSKQIVKYPNQGWHKQTGWEILSSLGIPLASAEEEECERVFEKKSDSKYVAEPSIGKMRSGSILHQSPVNLDKYTVDQIITGLQSNWTPEKLNEEYKNDDFLRPRGVEGLGDSLKENVKKRTEDYFKVISKFFDRDRIHPSYIYSLLRGIEEILRNKQTLSLAQTNQILGLFGEIKNSGGKESFRKKDDKSWLADWIEVHKVMADILLHVLRDKIQQVETYKTHRTQMRDQISYLLTIKDSPSKDDEKPEYGEPYHVAINSVRGRAYEAFVVFVENDGKTLNEDTKAIYTKTLSDDSLAIRFVIGRYLASFYFRDKDFIVGLFPQIFPKDIPDKKDIYLASWEGYLSNTLYDKLFSDLKGYYSHAISLDPEFYTERKYAKGLDESLAIHLALAFVHLGLGTSDPLFVQFWNIPNAKRHQEFISFIGQHCLTRDQAGDKWFADNTVSKQKLQDFWDWALEHVIEPEALAGFGFWINPDKEIFNDTFMVERVAQTLKKSDGAIDWDYGLTQRLPIFALKNGDKTIEIISHYFLDSAGEINKHRRTPFFNVDDEIKESLSTVYRNGNTSTKLAVTDLINKLIEKGSSIFWGLKEVIKEN